MSQNTLLLPGNLSPQSLPLPNFASQEAVEAKLQNTPSLWKDYLSLPLTMRQEFINFCTGKQGLKITYDTVFRKIFNPETKQGIHRLEGLLSSILNRSVRIIRIMPREGTQMTETASFVVMDILVQLDDNSFANVEMQKIGYNFPLARADCYVADIIMRQYVDVKSNYGPKFTFNDLHKVYSIIMMEKSPKEFHTINNNYIHRRKPTFDTGIFPHNSGLHEDIFICLDSFHSIVHNVTKDSTELDSWLTFLSCTEPETICSLIDTFPHFISIYQEIADFAQSPKELITMLSQELYIMDKNMERLMVAELQEEVIAARAELAEAKGAVEKVKADTEKLKSDNEKLKAAAKIQQEKATNEINILKLHCQHKTPQEIADTLNLSADYIVSVLSTI